MNRSPAVLRRIFRGSGILMSVRIVAGILSLAYLALAARALGAAGLGVLVLIHTYTLTVGNLVMVPGAPTVIRFGNFSVENCRCSDLQALLTLATILEWGSGLLAILVAAAIVPLVGPAFDWPVQVYPLAALYSLAIVSALVSTPSGVLYLYERFDLLAAQKMVAPSLRLIGAAIATATDAGLEGFLVAWLIAALGEGVSGWLFGLGELRRRGLARGILHWPRGVRAKHAGIWRFIWATKFDASLSQVGSRLVPLTVGWVLGPASAGLVHVALRLGNLVGQITQTLTQASYPAFAKVVARDHKGALKGVALRAGAVAAGAGLPILALVVVFREELLTVIAGKGFAAASGVMILIALARLIQLCGFPLQPTILALGHAGVSLRINATVTLGLFPLLIGLTKYLGPIGAGFHALAFAVAMVSLWAIAVRRLLR